MLIFVLSETSFDTKFINDTFTVRLSDVARQQPDLHHIQTHLAVKILHVGMPTTIQRIKQVEIYVNDMSMSQNAILILWGPQLKLLDLFEKGDVMGLFRPCISIGQGNKIQLECASETVLFLLPKEMTAISMVMAEVEINCTARKERLMVRQVLTNMINMSLLGTISEISGNARILLPFLS